MPIIRVLDFETTGMEPPAEVCEIGWSDYDTDTQRVYSPTNRLCRVDVMPAEVRGVHHITAEETADAMPWDAEAFLLECERDGVIALAAHHLKFEQQWLPADLGKLFLICTMKAALRTWPTAPDHKNQTLRYWLDDQGRLGSDFIASAAYPPHRAGPDAYVTAHVLKALFLTGAKGSDMVAWTRQPAVFPTCGIGAHRGKPWAEVPSGFLEWMTGKARDMDPDLVWNAQNELNRRDNRQ